MKFVHKTEVTAPMSLVDFLAGETALSKSCLKDCLIKGAVWLKRYPRKEFRVRRAKYQLRNKDIVTLYYDPVILAQPVPEPDCIADEGRYSVWDKPAGLLSQGTRYGDHCSLLRLVEKHFSNREVYLVHRLDREASGLVLVAHDKKAAAAFSALLGRQCTDSVEKWYRATVEGVFGETDRDFKIDLPLDGKNAVTMVTVVARDTAALRSDLKIRILTGRYHQIRRHLSMLGHPIAGDQRYGQAKGRENLRLQACRLSFSCPLSGKRRSYRLE